MLDENLNLMQAFLTFPIFGNSNSFSVVNNYKTLTENIKINFRYLFLKLWIHKIT